MASVTVKIRRNNVNRPEEVKRRIAAVLNDAVQEGVTVAKTLVPVDTGELRDSIHEDNIATPDNLKADFIADAPHAAPVEYGTVKMAAQPYMTPANEQARRLMKAGLKGVIRVR